jgi:phosphatidate cytidylyltransferase
VSPRPIGGRGRQRPPRRGDSATRSRILAAIPAIAFAIFIVVEGGIVFTLALIAIGVIALHELYTMMARVRPANLAGFLAVAALCLAAYYGSVRQLPLVLALSIPVTFFISLLRPRRADVSWAIAATTLGVVWIGLALAYAILLRKLPHGGGIMIDVLIGTFVGDTAAYFGGRAWGRRPLAPHISPNKTVEGLITGIVFGTLAFWLFSGYQNWYSGTHAFITGLVVALVAPAGDLFESLLKRDLDVKDTGRIFGAHGGVLDRLDAVFFSVVAGYYVTLALR